MNYESIRQCDQACICAEGQWGGGRACRCAAAPNWGYLPVVHTCEVRGAFRCGYLPPACGITLWLVQQCAGLGAFRRCRGASRRVGECPCFLLNQVGDWRRDASSPLSFVHIVWLSFQQRLMLRQSLAMASRLLLFFFWILTRLSWNFNGICLMVFVSHINFGFLSPLFKSVSL